ncbi:N-acetyltransferase GCN5 [Cadophora sp. MPI-SDFR-AT-0126]|nr:N-acetyltransferase GCN5 [Leotiomycetes sp. MPI-SDFR-AT-0126]
MSSYPPPPSHPIIPSLRSSSRLLVRELGFMSSVLAGTPYSASAVHAIVEIGLHEQKQTQATEQVTSSTLPPSKTKNTSTGITAATLCTELNLEKSSVSRLLKKLVEAGEVSEGYGDDAREKVLRLTEKGRETLKGIDTYGESQILAAFAQLPPTATPDDILKGISVYANALRSNRLHKAPPSTLRDSPANKITTPTPTTTITIHTGYRPGLLARCLTMHMNTYTPYGFGLDFEGMISTGFGELLTRLDPLTTQAFYALSSPSLTLTSSQSQSQSQIIGTLFMDGVDLTLPSTHSAKGHEYLSSVNGHPSRKVHLRGFIVDEGVRGGGVGRRLLDAAVVWADERGFEETHLWTFEGLRAARRLYEGRGFVLRDEELRPMWEGKELLVQHFMRIRPEGK